MRITGSIAQTGSGYSRRRVSGDEADRFDQGPIIGGPIEGIQLQGPDAVRCIGQGHRAGGRALHDAPGAAGHLVKFKKCALWLVAEMVSKGLAASRPDIDEGCWMFSVPSGHGPFMLCILSVDSRDESLFELLVTAIGGATDNVSGVIEDILRNAGEVTEQSVS